MEQNTITNPEIDAILEIEADDVSNPNDTSWANILLHSVNNICTKEQLKIIPFEERIGDETGIKRFSAIVIDGYYKLKDLRHKHRCYIKCDESSDKEYITSTANIYVIPYYKDLPKMSKDDFTHEFFRPSNAVGPTEYKLEDTVLLTHTETNISVFVNQRKELKENCETALDILKNKVLHHNLYTFHDNSVRTYRDQNRDSLSNDGENFNTFVNYITEEMLDVLSTAYVG